MRPIKYDVSYLIHIFILIKHIQNKYLYHKIMLGIFNAYKFRG